MRLTWDLKYTVEKLYRYVLTMVTEYYQQCRHYKRYTISLEKLIEDISLSGGGDSDKIMWCHCWKMNIRSMSTMKNLKCGCYTNDC